MEKVYAVAAVAVNLRSDSAILDEGPQRKAGLSHQRSLNISATD
jgi:hypothetical protein